MPLDNAPLDDGLLLDAYSRAVTGVVDKIGPAAKAGLLAGDLLLSLTDENGRAAKVEGADDLIRLLNGGRIDTPTIFAVLRGGVMEKRTVVPVERAAKR